MGQIHSFRDRASMQNNKFAAERVKHPCSSTVNKAGLLLSVICKKVGIIAKYYNNL